MERLPNQDQQADETASAQGEVARGVLPARRLASRAVAEWSGGPDALPGVEPEALAALILASKDPFGLNLAPDLPLTEAKTALMTLDTADGWAAYDLVHTLATFGRAW